MPRALESVDKLYLRQEIASYTGADCRGYIRWLIRILSIGNLSVSQEKKNV